MSEEHGISAHIVLVPDHSRIGDLMGEEPIFSVPPRVGEFLSVNDPEGIGQAFRILAVIHPPNIHRGTNIELRVEHVGTETELFGFINRGDEPPSIRDKH